MNYYRFLRPLFFYLSPERAHHVALALLNVLPQSFWTPVPVRPYQAMGLNFPHRVGLAAGLDKNGEYLSGLAKLGFAFIEVGTVTPRAQKGNPKPRLFRLPQAQALINRMGFNNQGVDQLVSNIQRANYQGILGINIGKNKDTPLFDAGHDYVTCLKKVYPYAAYVTVNISSPNTPDLRQLQQENFFDDLLQQLVEARLQLQDKYQRHVPLVVKISPDESHDDLKRMASSMIQRGIEGLIATNTTATRDGVEHLPLAQENGGLSGRPLSERATTCLKYLKAEVGEALTLIGAGGIDSTQAAQEKYAAGADLLQIYTGFIYQGPGLIRQIADQSHHYRY